MGFSKNDACFHYLVSPVHMGDFNHSSDTESKGPCISLDGTCISLDGTCISLDPMFNIELPFPGQAPSLLSSGGQEDPVVLQFLKPPIPPPPIAGSPSYNPSFPLLSSRLGDGRPAHSVSFVVSYTFLPLPVLVLILSSSSSPCPLLILSSSCSPCPHPLPVPSFYTLIFLLMVLTVFSHAPPSPQLQYRQT